MEPQIYANLEVHAKLSYQHYIPSTDVDGHENTVCDKSRRICVILCFKISGIELGKLTLKRCGPTQDTNTSP